jgi:DNA-binding response OmpR family regulator
MVTATADPPRAKRVLIVEPDESERTRLAGLVAAAAAKLGHSVELHEAADGAAAETMLDELAPDLVIAEVLLDEVSGLELLRRSRSRGHATSTSFLFVSRMNHEVDRYWALRNGAWGYEMKPFVDEILHRRIVGFLRGDARDLGAAPG